MTRHAGDVEKETGGGKKKKEKRIEKREDLSPLIRAPPGSPKIRHRDKGRRRPEGSSFAPFPASGVPLVRRPPAGIVRSAVMGGQGPGSVLTLLRATTKQATAEKLHMSCTGVPDGARWAMRSSR